MPIFEIEEKYQLVYFENDLLNEKLKEIAKSNEKKKIKVVAFKLSLRRN